MGVPVRRSLVQVRHCAEPGGLHPLRSARALVSEASGAVLCEDRRRSPGPLVLPFVVDKGFRFLQRLHRRLLRRRLTPRTAPLRCPFRHEARSPQVRASTFEARPLDIRRPALATRASWFQAHSPRRTDASIQFLFIGLPLRSALPLHGRSPFRSCALLRSRWPVHGRTFTFGWMPMLGALGVQIGESSLVNRRAW